MRRRHDTSKALMRTAYHEAGHACVRVWFRLGIRSVSIVQNGKSLGHVLRSRLLDDPDEMPSTLRSADYAEREIVASLAGEAAAALLDGQLGARPVVGPDMSSDVRTADLLAGRICGNDEVTSAYLDYLWIKVGAELGARLRWPAVQAVALALLERKTISGREVRRIIREARARPLRPLPADLIERFHRAPCGPNTPPAKR